MASVRKRRWTHKGVEKEAWVVDYTDNRGKRRQRTFDRKKDADKFRLAAEMEVQAGSHVARGDTMTVAAFAEEWLRYQEVRHADGTIGKGRLRNVRESVDRNITPLLGAIRLAELTFDDVSRAYQRMIKEQGLSANTAKGRLKILAFMTTYAMKREIMKKRPVHDFLLELRGVRDKRIRTFTTDEVSKLLHFAATKPRFGQHHTFRLVRLYVHLAALCGLRYGEISGLSPKNIDFDRGVIMVRRSFGQLREMKGPKSQAGVRDVLMPRLISDWLREWMAENWQENKLDLLLHRRDGTPFHYWNWYMRVWRPLLDRAGLGPKPGEEPFRFHALRHFAASNFLSHNMPLADVTRMMGHAHNSTTVNTYVHQIADSGHHRALVDRMADSLTAVFATTTQQSSLVH